MKQIDFDHGTVIGNILGAALPMLVAQILSLLYNIVDRIYIARIPSVGTTALGAVGLCFPIIVIMNIGYKTIYPGGYLSVGLWNGVSAGSSSSGSNSSSGSSNASSVSHSGVYYDLERYYYTKFENMRNDVYATCTLTSDEKLKKLTNLLKNKNDTYNLAFYNCANLSTHIWNIINDTNYYGFIESPTSNREQIMKQNPYYIGNNSLTSATNFQYYDNGKGTLISCTLHY